MKTLLISTFVLLTLLGCSNNQKPEKNKVICKITGTVTDRKDGNLFLYRPESSRFDQDTIHFANGHFEFTKTINSPEVFEIFFEEDLSVGPFLMIDFFIENGNVDITLSFNNRMNYQINGGKLNKMFVGVSKKIMSVNNEISTLYKNNSDMSTELIKTKSDSIENQFKNFIIEYISKNNNLISAYLLWEYRSWLGKDNLELFLPRLKHSFPDSRYIIETDAFLEGFGKNLPKQNFTDFKLLNTQKQGIPLSRIIKKHKLTLLLFWSSRCTGSDGKLYSYKKIYNEYKDLGFEIIGISDDNDLARWKRAIKRNEINWINLLDFDGKHAIDEFYHTNTKGNALIDQNGIIVSRISQPSQLKEILEKRLK